MQERSHDQKQTDIIVAVVNVISDACSCDFTSENIINSVFSCRSSETQVVFKAHLNYTSPFGSHTADELVSFFLHWVSSGPPLTVTGTVFSVDPSCPAELESLTSEDCVRQLLPTPTTLMINATIIWGPVFGVAVLLLLVVIIAMTSLFYIRQRRKKAIALSR